MSSSNPKKKHPFWGETTCMLLKKSSKTPCENAAYYLDNGKYCCGVHSDKTTRLILRKNPERKLLERQILENHNEQIEDISKNNKKHNKQGDVILFKMKMMKPVVLKKGYLNVFPNFKHGNRTDGWGIPSLSPMSIGPIDHGQPGLPQAKNLENFHQGNKVFPSEVDDTGEPTQLFYDTQLEMYRDDVPHRHKDAVFSVKGNKNVPLYSIWVTPDGVKNKVSYADSRQFYCNFYERATLKNQEFHELKRMIEDGFNVQICGYDAYPVTDTLVEHYMDTSRPFGHELVLYTMLVTDNPGDYPWRKHKTFDF